MKTKFYSIVAGLLLTTSVFAQVPQKMSYQAVIRNSSSALITSTPVGMKISVLQGTSTGTAVYVETQTPSTNANGLVSLEIGTGTVITGPFSAINWAAGPYFIKTETDPTGGTAYTIASTNKLMSVPYALFSATVTTNANLTGDVTSTGNATTIDALKVTNAMLAGSIDLTVKITETLPVANGGTGASSLTANTVLLRNGTSAIQAVAPETSGNVLTSNGITWTSAAAVAAAAGTLTGATLAPNVLNSSSTSVGTIELLPTGAIIKSGKVIVGTSSAASASAVLEANSTSQGFLPPRMTTTQRNAITAPAAGLQIYNIDNNCLETWNSNGWLSVCGGSILFNGVAIIGSVPNNWVQKTDFGGTGRSLAVAFSIGTKGYIGTGYDVISVLKKDFWEFDPVTNVWSQKADFGGTARYSAVGFSIGSKGYIGTGFDGTALRKDFWEYNPGTNTWTQKTDFGGTGRYEAVGFSIGTKGYIGTGTGGGNGEKVFWEFDPSVNTWTQKADFGGTGRTVAACFSIGNKGYIGKGNSAGSYMQDFWEYDQATNIWTQKAEFVDVGGGRVSATGFSIGTKGYIGTGNFGGKELWEYTQSSNTWNRKADLGGVARYSAVAFSIGTKGYIGTGIETSTGIKKSDFWEYSQ